MLQVRVLPGEPNFNVHAGFLEYQFRAGYESAFGATQALLSGMPIASEFELTCAALASLFSERRSAALI